MLNKGQHKSIGGTRPERPTLRGREVPVELCILRIAQVSFLGYLKGNAERIDMTTNETHTSTSPSQSKSDDASLVHHILGEVILNIPRKPKDEKLAPLTDEQKLLLHKIEADAIANFHGLLDELESALGMLRLGFHFGWKVLYLIHSKRTIRKYEEILNIKVRDIFPETGPSAYRSYGLNFAAKFSNFWKVAGGDIKIPDRRKIDP